MNEAVWFGAGFLLFRLASRCNLIPTKLEPSKFFFNGGALMSVECPLFVDL